MPAVTYTAARDELRTKFNSWKDQGEPAHVGNSATGCTEITHSTYRSLLTYYFPGVNIGNKSTFVKEYKLNKPDYHVRYANNTSLSGGKGVVHFNARWGLNDYAKNFVWHFRIV